MGLCALSLLSWDDVFAVNVLDCEGSVAVVTLRGPHADTARAVSKLKCTRTEKHTLDLEDSLDIGLKKKYLPPTGSRYQTKGLCTLGKLCASGL